LAERAILHRHHVVPRCDPRSTNNDCNLAVLCPNCHSLVHAGEIVIVGVYPSTDGRIPVWFRKGEDPPFPRELWMVKDNPLVRTIGGEEDDMPEEP
jgi:hypothetical protein